MQRLIEDYALEAYSPAEQRILAGVRYEMDLSDFSSLTRFTMAESVDVATVTAIKERQEFFQGVEVEVVPVREYTTTLASHVLGRTGPIYKADAEQYLEQGYQLSDTVGLDGIEKSMESVLRGVAGEKRVEQTLYGKTVEVISSKERPGGEKCHPLD